MTNNFCRSLILIFLVVLFLSLRSLTAIACVLLPVPTVLDAYEEADVVIIARMVSIEKTKEPDPMHLNVRSATMVVQKVFKGNVKPQDTISFAQGNGIDCLWMFDEKMIGHEYLLYLNTPEQGSDLWYIGGGRSGGLSENDLRYLNNIEKVRGKTRVSGTLEDAFPMAGRKVRIVGRSKTFQTTIDEHGVYEVYGLPPGKYLIAPELPYGWTIDKENSLPTVSERPSQSKTFKAFTLKAKRHAVIDFEFKIDNAVEGYVVDEKGRPLAQASVVLKPEKDASGSSTFIDNRGRFRFQSVAAGRYELIVHEPITKPLTRVGYYDPQKDRLLKSVPITIKHGQTMRGIRIIVSAAASTTR